MSGTLNVAVAQCPADLDAPQQRLAWLGDGLRGQASRSIDLIVLPELFQCGYHIGARVPELAEQQGGPFAKSIAQLARECDTAILYGYAERQGETLYNSAQCIDRTGTAIGNHRKLLLPPGFESDHFTPGSTCTPFKLGNFTLAILVCYDVEFPENTRHAALEGADLVVVPTALAMQWNVVAEKLVPARAFENGVFLCYANYCGLENGNSFFGGSCIIGPDGSEMARAGSGPEIVGARLDRSAVKAAQARLPYLVDRSGLPWVD